MNVLISLLGLSPGVATGAYYALYHGWGIDEPIKVDKVITVGTNAQGIDRVEDEIEREFMRWNSDTDNNIQYDETCRLRIEGSDLAREKDVKDFRVLITKLLHEDYKNDNVYLAVAGGRKSMAALAAVTAQLYGYGVQGMYHLYVDENLEKDGSFENFWSSIDDRRQREVMRPPSGQCNLVPIPYLQFKGRDGEISLTLSGEVQDYIIQYLDENPSFIPKIEAKSKGNVLGYMFEVKVMEYLRQKEGYTRVSHHYILPGHKGDIDVFAEKDGKILICECKLFLNYDPECHLVESKKVDQIAERVNILRDRYPDAKVEAWVVSNAENAEDEAWYWAKKYEVKMKTTGPIEDKFRTTLIDWKIPRIYDMKSPDQFDQK
jgi:CRISPR-associated protein (TIGR02584 family)